jgi:hypothetical protein
MKENVGCGVKVIVQCYSLVKLPDAEPGNDRKIIMQTEGQGKSKR